MHQQIPLTIDRADTPDRDDAITITHSTAGWTLTVHIADVAGGLTPRAPADLQARQRGATRYGRDHTRHMLPDPLIRRRTLTDTAERPTIAITLYLNPDGTPAADPFLSRGRTITAALDHQQVLHALTDPAHPHHTHLAHARNCAQALYAARRASGALAVYDLVRGWAANDDGQLIRLDDPERNIAYVIVQEAMIAANAAIATWAIRNDIPILFRNHAAALAAPGAADLAADVDAAVRSGAAHLDAARQRLAVLLKPADYAPTARGHYALTLPAYTHATSPLRRYADLVTQRQIAAALDGRALPYTTAELQEIADEIKAAEAQRRERRTAALKDRAHTAARARAAAENFTHLTADKFTAILKRAAKENLHSPQLETEVRRRATTGRLGLADLFHVLTYATSEEWRPLRAHLLSHLADQPHQAVSVLAMRAQTESTPVVYEQRALDGTPPSFTARAAYRDQHGARRLAGTKKLAQQLAAVSLLAVLAGVTDPSADAPPAAAPAAAAAAAPPAPAEGQHPVSVLNEYAQTGHATGITWDVNRAGPDHAPAFTAWVTATITGLGELKASGTAASKAGARERAAAALLQQLTDKTHS